MAFRPVESAANVAKNCAVPMAASTTITAGSALVWSSGLITNASSGTTEVNFVAKEGKVSGAGENPLIEVIRVEGTLFEADCTSNTAAAHRGTKCDLTDANNLANTTSSNDVFLIESLVGAAADKKAIGRFVQKTT